MLLIYEKLWLKTLNLFTLFECTRSSWGLGAISNITRMINESHKLFADLEES